MSRIPRILPLVGVAIGGVVAVNALAGARALPDLFTATRAAAEEAMHAKPSKSHAPGSAEPAAAPKAISPLPPGGASTPAATIAPVCAPSPADLAKAAGLSPAELQVLQSLQARRGQIDDRAKDLDTEVQLLNAAESKLDARLAAMNSLKADIQGLMGQADQKTQGEVDRLVVVYSKMKPADAAAVMAQLDDKVRLPIAAGMKPAVLSAILDKMATLDAKVLTEKLAHRFAPAQALADAANAPPGSAPGAAPGAAKSPASGKVAKAAPSDQADDDAADAPPDAAKATPDRKSSTSRPRRIARAPARKSASSAQRAKAKPSAEALAPTLPDKPQPYAAAKYKSAPALPAKVS
jgi:flagellar motility protein MotE (MotC chaperone)